MPAYNAFVSGSLIPFTTESCFGLGVPGNDSAVDLGPLAWPVAGYLNASGAKTSYGVRQPGGVVSWGGGSVYLFWIDNAFDTADVWAAKAVLSGRDERSAAADTANATKIAPAPSFFSFNTSGQVSPRSAR
jgi:hypothetical protein